MPPRTTLAIQRTRAADIHASPQSNPPSWTSQAPNPSVDSAPTPTSATAGLVSPRRRAISLGRSRRDASAWSAPTATAPETNRNAPTRWKPSSHCSVVTARSLLPALLQSVDGGIRPSPASADGDDRRRQLDARPRGSARARRQVGGGGAGGGRVLRLPLRRPLGRARPARDARHRRRADDT